MMSKIRKRDGRVVPLQQEKIAEALIKALKVTNVADADKIGAELSWDVVAIVKDQLAPGQIPSVEGVQDVVERVLMKTGYLDTAKSYILYREQHKEIRDLKGALTNLDLVESYVEKSDWRVKENANMEYSLQGLNLHASSAISTQYWLNKIYPEVIRNAHLNGQVHIHDLGILAPYCVGWDLQDLLMRGFTGVKGKVCSKPPKHYYSALGQIINFFFTLQGEAAGAQAISNFDTLIAPFIRADGLNYKEVKQGLQEFMFNMNVPTRVGFQAPFTNVTLDLKVPEFMKDEPVIIGGEIKNETYGQFQKEMDMFNEAFAEVMTEGDATGRVFTFPIPTYNISKDFDWDNPVYDKIWKMTAKFGIPYFSNFINSDMKPEDARSMCCRLRLDNRELRKRGGGLFGSSPLTGSIGVVTINMPQLAYLAKDEKDFFEKLEKLMDIARDSLEIKRKVLEQLTDKSLYPYSKFYLQKIHESSGIYWKNHFSTIGLVGMNEACLNLIKENISSPAGREFAEKTLVFMRDRLGKYQEETGSIYNLEATPAEGTSYRLARIDKKKFPNILVADNDPAIAPYYTNSTQLPVGNDNLFDSLDLQEPLQTKYTGGTVFHIFIGEKEPSIDAVKSLVKKICENYSMPYFTLTPTFSICPQHGYSFGEHEFCQKCNSACEVYSRVVGYLRPVAQWNEGKQAEFKERNLFDSAFNNLEVAKIK